MALTKVTGQVINTNTDVTVGVLTVTNTLAVGGTVSIGGTLTYEDVTNIDSVGLITARNGIVVGSGITLSKDGDVFFTGIATGNASGLTALNASNISSGTVPTARLGSGTASSSTFLRGDSTFATVTSTTINNNADNRIITGSGTANTLEAESGLTFDGTNLDLGANDKKIRLGASNQLYFEANSGGYGLFQNNTGIMYLLSNDFIFRDQTTNEDLLKLIGDGAVELYHNNVKRFETTSNGATFNGTSGSHTEINILGYEDKDARLNLSADEGDDNADKWRMVASVDSNFYLQNYASGSWEWNLRASGNGAVELYYDNSKKLETTTNGISVTGSVIPTGNVNLGDSSNSNNNRFIVGASDDLQIYHDGSESVIGNSTGTLQILSPNEMRFRATTFQFISYGNDETMAKFIDDGAVELYHNNSKKLQSASHGVDVFGLLQVQGNCAPSADNTYDLGTSSERWRNLYTTDLQLSNEGKSNDVDGTWGNYTIQEGENDLFLINNRSGKKYKFNLTEVS